MIYRWEASGRTVDEAIEAGLKAQSVQREEVQIEILEMPKTRMFGLLGNSDARVLLVLVDGQGNPLTPPPDKEPVRTPPPSHKDPKPRDKVVSDPRPRREKRPSSPPAPQADPPPESVPREEGAKAASSPRAPRATEMTSSVRERGEAALAFLTPIFRVLEVSPDMETETRDDYTYLHFSGDDLGILIGRRGETLDALQYLTNLAANRTLGERTHLILDVEGYRAKRQDTLERLAQRLARKAVKTSRKVVLEPMNPQERRVIHTALQEDPLVTTLSEGEEPYRKVVIKPARDR